MNDNDRIHDILDGNATEESLNGSSEDLQSLAEMRRLKDALQAHGSHGALSATDKAAIGGALAATIGGSAGSSSTALVAGGGGGSWIGSIGLLILGGLIGAGFFLLTDEDQSKTAVTQTITTGIIIEAEATTPALFPFALPEPSAHDECVKKINTLENEIEALTATKEVTETPVRRKKRRFNGDPFKATTGD